MVYGENALFILACSATGGVNLFAFFTRFFAWLCKAKLYSTAPRAYSGPNGGASAALYLPRHSSADQVNNKIIDADAASRAIVLDLLLFMFWNKESKSRVMLFVILIVVFDLIVFFSFHLITSE